LLFLTRFFDFFGGTIRISVDCQKNVGKLIELVLSEGRHNARIVFSGKARADRHEFGGDGGVSQSEAGTQPTSSKKKEEIQ
jgi:hypothetical protein